MTDTTIDVPGDDLSVARTHVSHAYSRLDAMRALAAERFTNATTGTKGGTHQARSERDATADHYAHRIQELDMIEDGLTFGRLDRMTGRTRADNLPDTIWIGRIGLLDDDHSVLQVDWRAPAAAAFYQATHAHNHDVESRTHITTRHRDVVDLVKDILDLELLADATASGAAPAAAGSDAALMAALTANRTGRMNDIIATIQAEQDAIIRADIRGTLVVAGGPGTGKTAVALHRAAYLLYTYRERLENSGVLIVGPNPTWTRYIDHVLPSLGETSVVSTTISTLLPGIITTQDDSAEVAAIKGDARMADVIANAVKLLPRLDRAPLKLRLLDLSFELRPHDVRRAMSFAQGQFDTYNEQRVPFLKNLLDIAITRVANARKLDAGNAEVREEIGDELREDVNVRREFNLLWMPVDELTALRRLLSNPSLLARAAHGILSTHEQDLIRRAADAGLTTSDVPLLDEFADLLGPVTNESAVHALALAQQQATLAALLSQAERDGAGFDSGGLDAYHGMVDSTLMLERYTTGQINGTLSERAAGDREWTYGHIVVDEAQELSPMAWRAIVRRVPSKSMTVVGDLAQASSSAAADSWAHALDRVTGGNWRLETLTVNYRTPGRLLIPAHELLVERGLGGSEPVSAREGDADPVHYSVTTQEIPTVVARVLGDNAAALGTWAVIATDDELPHVRGHLAATGFIDPAISQLDARISLLTAHESKGLEFDHIIVVDPAAIRRSSAAGDADLYVALTRPTQSLHVIETSGA